MLTNTASVSILIVDDSEIVRTALRSILEHAGFNVIGEAHNGEQGVAMACRMKPRLIIMDLEMPVMDGLEAIEQIMARAPTRILVMTAVPHYQGMEAAFESMSRGALDLLPKPSGFPGPTEEQELFVSTVLQLADIPVVRHIRGARKRKERLERASSELPFGQSFSVLAIGGSTGAPGILDSILSALPADFPIPIVIAQHLVDQFAPGLVHWLGDKSKLSVELARPGARLRAGTAQVVAHTPSLEVGTGGVLQIANEASEMAYSPSADVLFQSVASQFGRRSLAILLSGMGKDGAKGMKAIHDAGGYTIAQDEETSTVFGMPKAAIELGAVERIMSPDQIVQLLPALGGSARALLMGEGSE